MLALLLLLTAARPVLEFPEPGLDNPAAYQGYHTRFYRDARGDAVQVYLDGRSGRVVLLWADAADQSAAFTARDTAGAPVVLAWGSPGADVSAAEGHRAVAYRLRLPARPVAVGQFALGSMRWERDIQYQRLHLAPIDSTLPPVPELAELVERLGRLDAPERHRHLALLAAPDVEALRARLEPSIALAPGDTAWTVRVEQPSFDGKHHLALELSGSSRACGVELERGWIKIRPRVPSAPSLVIRVVTDAAPLTPLGREQIFNAAFRAFYERVRRQGPRTLRFRRLEREVRGLELLSYEEKLMAGLPNFATYFGRDMLMSALMLEPIWAPVMFEHVLASVLRKVSDAGEVSHEEALDGQAIRENAAEYNALLAGADAAAAQHRDSLVAKARPVLEGLDAVCENYHMVDEDFQLPVVAARYLANPAVPADAKRRFLRAPARDGAATTRLEALLRNFNRVAERAAAYAQAPEPTNLVSFPPVPGDGFSSASWRDSRVGYAGGRFAMDINVVWVPEALAGIATALSGFAALGVPADTLEQAARRSGCAALEEYLRDPSPLRRARERWATAARNFEVRIGAAEVRERLAEWLAWLPEPERRYWRAVSDTLGIPGDTLRFLALALDEAGRPIPVVNTDPGTLVFLGEIDPARAFDAIEPLLLPYPVGLLVPGLGPLVANDAYAARAVWEDFRRDPYHSPRVVWGREVNLMLLGLARQIRAAGDKPDIRRSLRAALERVRAAAERSGLANAELWSYRIERGALRPVRYGASSDVQLWNLTDLSVQFTLAGALGGRNHP